MEEPLEELKQQPPKHDVMQLDQRDQKIVGWVRERQNKGLDRTQLIRGSLKGATEADFTTTQGPLNFEPSVSAKSQRRYIKLGWIDIPSTVIAMTKDLPFPEGAGAVDVPIPKFDETGNLVPKESYILVFTPDQYNQLLAAWDTQNSERS